MLFQLICPRTAMHVVVQPIAQKSSQIEGTLRQQMIQKGRAQLRATYDFPSHGDSYVYLLDWMKIITSTQGSYTNEEWRANRVGI